jgi:hypothetical protein
MKIVITQGGVASDLEFHVARLEGLEPPTGCLEGRFGQGVNLCVSRSEAVHVARG